MKALIWKDLQLLKYVNFIIGIVGILFTFVIMSQEVFFISQLAYAFLAFVFPYVASMFLSQHESKSQGDVVVNSLPVKRREIVKARYYTLGVYSLGINILMFVLSTLIGVFMSDSFRGSPSSIFTIFLAIAFTLIFFSLYLPFQYYSQGKVQIFNGIFYLLLMLIPNILRRYGQKIMATKFFNVLVSLDFVILSFVLLLFSLLLYALSFGISTIIYKNKEF